MLLTAVLMPAEEGGFVAYNPETGTTTQGESVPEAISNLREATELYLEEFPLRADRPGVGLDLRGCGSCQDFLAFPAPRLFAHWSDLALQLSANAAATSSCVAARPVVRSKPSRDQDRHTRRRSPAGRGLSRGVQRRALNQLAEHKRPRAIRWLPGWSLALPGFALLKARPSGMAKETARRRPVRGGHRAVGAGAGGFPVRFSPFCQHALIHSDGHGRDSKNRSLPSASEFPIFGTSS